MKKITLYEPAMCCSTGVCGTEIDTGLLRVASMLTKIGGHGVKVERYNLAQQPIAFAENTEVRTLIQNEGTEILPLLYIDGKLELKGRYPDISERTALLTRAQEAAVSNT